MSAPSATLNAPARPAPSRWAPLVVAVAFAVAALAAMIVANGIARGALYYPGCTLKLLTGIPCPGCGGTRCLAALSHGDWILALVMNPLVALGAVLAWTAVPLTWFDVAINGGRGAATLGGLVRTRTFRWMMMALVAANWAWLCYEGR